MPRSIKIEASKFTEVGYVGRDVEAIIRDLTEQSVNQVKSSSLQRVERKAEDLAEDRVLDLLLPSQATGLQEEAPSSGQSTSGENTPDRNSASSCGKVGLIIGPWKSKPRNGACRSGSSPTSAAWKNSKIICATCWVD